MDWKCLGNRQKSLRHRKGAFPVPMLPITVRATVSQEEKEKFCRCSFHRTEIKEFFRGKEGRRLPRFLQKQFASLPLFPRQEGTRASLPEAEGAERTVRKSGQKKIPHRERHGILFPSEETAVILRSTRQRASLRPEQESLRSWVRGEP